MGFFFKDEALKRDEEQRKALRRGTAPDMEFSDYPKAIRRSGYNTAAGIASAKQYVQGKLGNKAAVAEAELDQRQMELSGQQEETSMSPGGRNMVNAPVLPDGEKYTKFGSHPFDAFFSIVADQAAPLAITAVPGGAWGRIGQVLIKGAGKYAATGTVAGTTAVLGTGQAVQEVKSYIKDMSDEELASESPVFKKLLEDGVNPKQARKDTTDLAVDTVGNLAVPVYLALGLFGAEVMVAKRLGGAAASGGVLKSAGKALRTEIPQEFSEEASSKIISDFALGESTDNINWLEAARRGFEAAAQAAVIAGPLGGLAGIGGGKPKIPVVDTKSPDAAQAAAAQAAPLPPQPTPPKPSTPASVVATPPVGPPVVAPGAHTPPPDAAKPQKDSRKKSVKAGKGTPAVEVSAVPAPDVVEALTQTAPPPPVQAPPEIAPPVTQGVTPAPEGTPRRAREFMEQQGLLPPAPPVVAPPAPAVTPAPPIEEVVAPVQEVIQPPIALPPVAAPVETVPPGSAAARLPPQVLPDLAAQREQQRKMGINTQQGQAYELGVDLSEVEDLPRHQAWRRKMIVEARGTADPLTARMGEWRDADITVTSDDGTTATVKAGPAIDYQTKRIKSLKQLLDCVNAS